MIVGDKSASVGPPCRGDFRRQVNPRETSPTKPGADFVAPRTQGRGKPRSLFRQKGPTLAISRDYALK